MPLALAGLCLAAQPAPAAQAASKPPQAAEQAPPAVKNSGAPLGYRIGAGDVLQINVWRESEVSVQGIVVRPDGKITLPLLKEVDVLGQTPAELEKNLAAKLAQFINGADVTVVVREIHSKKVYMVGAVNRVGPIPLLALGTHRPAGPGRSRRRQRLRQAEKDLRDAHRERQAN